MLFCPYCSTRMNLSAVETLSFQCANCPYHFLVAQLNGEVSVRGLMQRDASYDYHNYREIAKQNGGEQIISVDHCINSQCNSHKASFIQMQIRSADEPMTVILKCVKCFETWRLE